MSKFYFLIIALFSFTASFAANKQFAVNNGNWNDAASWTPTGVPQSGDKISIPANLTALVSGTDVSISNVTLDIYGKLKMSGENIKMSFGFLSTIVLHTGGSIIGDKNSQQIWLNGKIYEGTTTLAGPKIASSTASLIGFAPYSEITLPVKFISFNVSVSNNNNLIQWATAEEVNAFVYEVERSVDGATWSNVGTVAAVGNTTQVSNYSFTDKNSAAVVYYRIKQVDADGKFTYTAIKSLKRADATSVAIAASNKSVAISFSKQVKEKVELQIVNFNGQVIAKQTVNEPVGQVIFTPQANIKGNYIVLVSSNSLKVARQVNL